MEDVTYSTGLSGDSFLNILVLGYLIDCLLMGVVLHQTSAYFANFPNHRTIIQRMVRVIFVGSVIQTLCHIISCLSILGYKDDTIKLMEYCFTATSAFIARLINPFLMGIAHVLLAHRCLAFTNSLRVWANSSMLMFRSSLWAATILCWAFGLSGIVIGYTAFKTLGVVVGPVPRMAAMSHYMAISNLVSASILDSIIAAVMIYELHKSKTAFQGTKSVVETMSRILVANGFLLTVYQLAIALAQAFGTAHNASALIVVANDLIGKIYAITSLLAICRPLEAERLRNNPAHYAQRSRGSCDTTTAFPASDETAVNRKGGPSTDPSTSTAIHSSQLSHRRSLHRAGSSSNDLEANRTPEEVDPLELSDTDVDEAKLKSSSSSTSDFDPTLATLRFVDQPQTTNASLKRNGASSLGLLNIHHHHHSSRTRGGRPSTAPGSTSRSPMTYSPTTPVRTIAGMGTEYGLDLDYITAPMEEEGVVKSPNSARGPSPRLFD